MAVRPLRTVTRAQGNNRALISGQVVPEGFALQFEDVPVLVDGFRRMVRELAYDVCEMAVTTYLCARQHGVRFTALPVFLVRGFHHGAVLQHADSGLRSPKQLEGRRVGVNRGYTVTTGVWARGILADEYDLDLDAVTWVLSGDEHVESYRPPSNVVAAEPDTDLGELLARGELPAAVGVKSADPGVVPLIPDPDTAAWRAFESRGLYPINHLIVVRDELLAEHPDLAPRLFDAFVASKERYLDQLRAGTIEEPTATDRLNQRLLAHMDDPLPYGIEANRAMLTELVRHARQQHILHDPVNVDEMFAASTRTLRG